MPEATWSTAPGRPTPCGYWPWSSVQFAKLVAPAGAAEGVVSGCVCAVVRGAMVEGAAGAMGATGATGATGAAEDGAASGAAAGAGVLAGASALVLGDAVPLLVVLAPHPATRIIAPAKTYRFINMC